MSVLVFGGSGLVGTALKNLKPNWTYLSSKDGDLRNMRKCIKLFDKYKPDKVIFLAAIVGGLYKNLNANYEMYIDNMKMQMNIIECCNRYNINEGIFCLSTCIFPNKVEYPIKEESLHNGEPHSSNYGYAYAKRNMEIMVRLLNQKNDSKFKCITPTNIYGENDNFNLQNAHVIPALIHKAYLANKNKEKFVLKGTGNALRQFVYSMDIARIIVELLNNPFIDEHNFIITPKEEISIKKIAVMIAKNFNINPEDIVYDKKYSDGQYKKTCSNSRLLNILPNFEFTLLEDGLERTIDWFKKYYNYGLRK